MPGDSKTRQTSIVCHDLFRTQSTHVGQLPNLARRENVWLLALELRGPALGSWSVCTAGGEIFVGNLGKLNLERIDIPSSACWSEKLANTIATAQSRPTHHRPGSRTRNQQTARLEPAPRARHRQTSARKWRRPRSSRLCPCVHSATKASVCQNRSRFAALRPQRANRPPPRSRASIRLRPRRHRSPTLLRLRLLLPILPRCRTRNQVRCLWRKDVCLLRRWKSCPRCLVIR